MREPKDGEWTKPPVLLNIVSIILLVIGGYLATQRDDGAQTRRDLAETNRRLTVLETKQDILWNERERDEPRRRE